MKIALCEMKQDYQPTETRHTEETTAQRRMKSFFKVTHYDYSSNKHPRIFLHEAPETYCPTLAEAEAVVQTYARKRYSYAHVIAEVPMGMAIEYGDNLSLRVYDDEGHLWSEQPYATFHPMVALREDADEHLRHFEGRSAEEIRFQPGDFVEVLCCGYGAPTDSNGSGAELAIVVDVPPCHEELMQRKAEYEATGQGIEPQLNSHNDYYIVALTAREQWWCRAPVAFTRPVSLPVHWQRANLLKKKYEVFREVFTANKDRMEWQDCWRRAEEAFARRKDNMLEKLKEQEARLVKEQQSHLPEGEIKLSPKIDVEECLRNGGITADDYRKSHQL